MGFTFARMRISRKLNGKWRSLRLLADTGAFYTVIPGRILKELRIVPIRRTSLKVADGRIMQRDLGGVYVRYRDIVGSTEVVFGERGDSPVLVVCTLEALALKVDPRTHRLREEKVVLWVTATHAPSESDLQPPS